MFMQDLLHNPPRCYLKGTPRDLPPRNILSNFDSPEQPASRTMGDPAPESISIDKIHQIGTEPFLQVEATTAKNRSVRIEGPPKRLIICCDGSWQSSNHGQMNVPSNVARLSRAIARCGLADDKGDAIHQIVYYNAGVGTGTSKKDDQNWLANTMAGIQKTWEGAFGRGLEENVCEGYNFLVSRKTSIARA